MEHVLCEACSGASLPVRFLSSLSMFGWRGRDVIYWLAQTRYPSGTMLVLLAKVPVFKKCFRELMVFLRRLLLEEFAFEQSNSESFFIVCHCCGHPSSSSCWRKLEWLLPLAQQTSVFPWVLFLSRNDSHCPGTSVLLNKDYHRCPSQPEQRVGWSVLADDTDVAVFPKFRQDPQWQPSWQSVLMEVSNIWISFICVCPHSVQKTFPWVTPK